MRNILIAVVIAIVAVGVYFFLNAGSIIEKVIETVGTDATGTSVEVGSVELDLSEGRAGIFDFTIDNPDGFSSGHAFSLDEISVVVDTENSTRDLLVLSEVVVSSPRVLYEIAEGGSNMDVIRASVEEYQARVGDSGGGEASNGGSDTKMIIDRLRFTGGEVIATAAGEQIEVDLPPLTLNNIGRASGGETAAAVAAQVADRLTSHVMQTVARAEIERRLGVEGVMDRVRDIFGQ